MVTSACGKFVPDDLFVTAALHSDCDDCRVAIGIGPVGSRGCEVREPPQFSPEPDPDADVALARAIARRDGAW